MHRELADVTSFDEDLAVLVRDMVATMRAAHGVGLAANQVGVDLKVFVFDCPDADDVPVTGVVCNPVLTLPEGKDRNLDAADEGCLSLPGAYTECSRPDEAHVRGVDEHGEPVEFTGTGLLARCLQHETDHLFGTVFGDRLPARSRKQLHKQHEELASHYPDDWPVSPIVAAE
jgi:peptide deformylase